MVASISARGNAKAALAYYDHLRQDDYYTREGEPPGRWAGGAAARLSLQGPVTQAEFDGALNGVDPKTGERLVQRGAQAHRHAACWDMTFSAPKSVSVLWALSEPEERAAIEAAQRTAVMEATRYLEKEAAWCRRGQGGGHREQAACLLVAQFDHYTSRELDPQIHTHCFVFNVAPRKDGSWGAIVSRELYKAQKQAGANYRNALARGLKRSGYALESQGDSFRVVAIPRHVEQAFLKRRRAIEDAARAHGYETPKGMELATLRTRKAKHHTRLSVLFQTWQADARAMDFEVRRVRQKDRDAGSPLPKSERQLPTTTPHQPKKATWWRSPPNAAASVVASTAAQIGGQFSRFLGQLKQPSAIPGVRLKLRSKRNDRERD